MTNLNNRSALHPRWTSWGGHTLASFQVCQITLYYMDMRDQSKSFDPYAGPGTGSNAPQVMWSGEAQVSFYRQTLVGDDVAGSVGMIRSARVTLPKSAVGMSIPKGLIVRVDDVPENSDLERREFVVKSGVNGSLPFTWTLDCEVDQSVITSDTPLPPFSGGLDGGTP